MTWANQIRVLMQQIGDVGKNIGNMVIGALKPFVQSLNAVLARVREFTKNVLDALGHIFGWEVETSGGGTDLGDLGDEAGDLSGNLEDADKAAKAVKNTILGFDELNVLNGANDSGDNASGAADDLSDGLDSMVIQLRRTEPIWKEYESEIDTLYELGQYFADALNSFASGFDVDGFRSKMSSFGEGLAEFLNGFNDPNMFASVSNVIVGGLNGLVDGVNGFLESFDTKRFNDSISALFAGILNIDWPNVQKAAKNVGETAADILNGVLSFENLGSLGTGLGQQVQAVIQSLFSAVTNINWPEIGKSLANGVNNFVKQIDPKKLFSGLVEGIGGIGAMIGAAIGNIDWIKILGTALAGIGGIVLGIFKGMFALSGEVAVGIGKAIGKLVKNIGGFFAGVGKAIFDKIGNLGSNISTWAGNVRDKFREKIIGTDGNGGIRGKIVEWFRNMPAKIFSAIGTFGGKIKEWGENVGAKFRKTLIGEDGNGGVRGKIIEWFRNLPAKIFSAIGTLGTHIKEWGGKVRDKFRKTLIGEDGNGGVRGKIIEWFGNLPTKIFSAIGTLGSKIKEWGTTVRDKFRNTLIGEDGNGGVRGKIVEWFGNMPGKIFSGIGTMWDKIKEWAGTIKDNFKNRLVGDDGEGGLIGDIKSWFAGLPGKIFDGIGGMWSNIVSWVSTVKDNFIDRISGSSSGNLLTDIAWEFFKLPGKIFSYIGNMASNIASWIGTVKDKFGDKILGRNGETSLLEDIAGFFSGIWGKMVSVGDDIVGGIWEGINGAWEWIKSKVTGFADNLVNLFNLQWLIGSPSKLMAEKGGYLIEGLQNGMEDEYDSVIRSAGVFAGRLANAVVAVPEINTSGMFNPALNNLNVNGTATVGLDIESIHDAVVSGVEIALSGQQERPIVVNAELRTQNDEVLARAVTRGQRSIAYRTSPAALVY